MSMRRELVYLSSHATNHYFIPNWGKLMLYSVTLYFLSTLRALPSEFMMMLMPFFTLSIICPPTE